MKKIRLSFYSNSSKTCTKITQITDEDFTFILYRERLEGLTPNPQRRGVTTKEELPISLEEKELFLEKKAQNNELKEKAQNAQKQALEKLQQEKEKFLDSVFLGEIKYRDFFEELVEKLQTNGDYTTYSQLDLAVAALGHNKIISMHWTDAYNSRPVYNGTILKDISQNIFYLVDENNKLTYKVICPEEGETPLFCEVGFQDFQFQIQQI